jgi:ATP-dependent Clp protease protease subunit
MNRSMLRASILAAQFREVRARHNPGTPRARFAAYALERPRSMPKEGGDPVAAAPAPKIFARISGADGDRGELYVYETIGFDCFAENGGLTANKVKDALSEMKGVKTLNVFVNSEGGDVFEAKSIFTQLQRFDAEKVVHIDGLAASAATLIAMAGDRIVTSPVATWMIHEAWSGAMGNATDMRKMAALLELENGTIAETYARQTGKPVDELLALMAAETWMNAAQALELGITDEISDVDDDETEGDDDVDAEESGEHMTNRRRSPFAVAAAVTASRLNAVSTGDLMKARADMRRRNLSTGQPVNSRTPASR